MFEWSARDRYSHAAHVREIRSSQSARLMHLGEEHFLRRPDGRTPAPNLPLQSTKLAVGKSARILPLQLHKQCLRLQPRIERQLRLHLRPNLGKGIRPRSPRMRQSDFAGPSLQTPVLTCRLLIHVAPQGAGSQRHAVRQSSPQRLHLLVRDHRKPPCNKSLRQSKARNSNCRRARTSAQLKPSASCRWPGIPIVVSGKSNCR